MDYSKLTKEELSAKATQVLMVRSLCSGVGFVGGLYYSFKSGGGFWRYVRLGILGSMVAGVGGYAATYPMSSKIIMANAKFVAQEQKESANTEKK